MTKTQPRISFPIWALNLGVFLTIASLLAVTALLYESNRTYQPMISRTMELAALKGEIMRLDEVLTMSARMNAATGNVKWEERYKQNVDPLDQAIKRVIEIVPESASGEDAKETDAANIKLVAMEEKSFELVRARKFAEANSILFGEEYEKQKTIYANGMKMLAANIDQHSRDSIEGLRSRSFIALVVALSLVPIMGIAWFFILQTVTRWKTYLLDLNNHLDQEVEARTAQLQIEKIRSLSAAKMATLGEMAGGIAHEINNPLGVIHGFSELLLEQCAEAELVKEEVTFAAGKIKDATERISKIIQGLRSVSRDGSRDQFQETAISSIISETLSLCEQRMYNRGIKFSVRGGDQGLKISCRAVEISQVLLNLLSNACDAVDACEEKKIFLEIISDSSFAYIDVMDTGKGIPKDIEEKIMQPFFSTKPVGKGTGLGLSISRNLLESHGGSLELMRDKKNTCFRITLPLASKKAA